MKLHNATAELYVPDSSPEPEALARTTHLAIGAHQDDLEIMAYHGIATCYERPDLWFGGVTCTNGAGSSRTGVYASYSDDDMMAVRRAEQRKAAFLGGYSMAAQLDYPSSAVKDPADTALRDDLVVILEATRPRFVYTHNPADKHPTHIGVLAATIAAIRALPKDRRPERVWGCEVWRNLDWLPDADKVALDVSARENLAAALVGLFDSQISGGKRYDLATLGRWRANATYFDSHGVDEATGITWAIDLTPVAVDESVGLVEHTLAHIDRFREDVRAKLERQLGR